MLPSPLFGSLVVLTIWTVVLGLMVGRFEFFLAAVPLVVALLSARKPVAASSISITASPSSIRLTEGDRFDLVVVVACPKATSPSIEIFLPLANTFDFVEGRPHLATSLRAGETFQWKLAVRSTTRGRVVVGPFNVRVSDDAGLLVDEARVGLAVEIETYPRIPMVRQLPRPRHTRSSFGNYVGAQFGAGLETAETRLFAPGDRVRQVNWPASLRLGRLYVNQFHQERSAEVVLLLDTLAEIGASPHSSLDVSVRAVTALASAYIARKDRVGYVEFGGHLRWLKPAAGRHQWERLLRSALPASQHFTYLTRTLDHVPAAALPRQALVIAVSPVIDDRFTRAIVDLAGRGYDVVLLAVSPVGLTRRVLPDTPLNDVACALWALERASRIRQLCDEGISVTEWQPEQPLDAALASLARRAPVRRNMP
ncbi:MAG: DUF58 domain-containing protein [Rhodospirillales bacterium]|nr:DUF58 domain-containing protein [Rhodospirillales bacterium]